MATNNKPQGFHPGAASVCTWPKPVAVVIRSLFYTATRPKSKALLEGEKDE